MNSQHNACLIKHHTMETYGRLEVCSTHSSAWH